MTEVSEKLRTIFFPKYPRFWNLKLDFFPLKIFSAFFFQIGKKQVNLNFRWANFLQDQRTFKKVPFYLWQFDSFFPKYPQFKTWSWVFFHFKNFPIFFPNQEKISPPELHLSKFSAKSKKLFSVITNPTRKTETNEIYSVMFWGL